MAKILVVRKTDKTIHKIPLSNKAALMAHNSRLPFNMRMKLEEMEESEAMKLPFIDDDYVSPSEAQAKLKEAQGELSEKDTVIAELEAKLAALTAANAKPQKADELIDLIGKAETVDAANAFLEGETRVTVLAAIKNRIAELTK